MLYFGKYATRVLYTVTINDRIKEARIAIGLSQVKFAKRMAISSSYLAEIELSNRSANERIIRLLSAEFGVDAHWLRTGEGSMFNTDTDIEALEILNLFKSFNPQFRRCALKQMGELASLYAQLQIEP